MAVPWSIERSGKLESGGIRRQSPSTSSEILTLCPKKTAAALRRLQFPASYLSLVHSLLLVKSYFGTRKTRRPRHFVSAQIQAIKAWEILHTSFKTPLYTHFSAFTLAHLLLLCLRSIQLTRTNAVLRNPLSMPCVHFIPLRCVVSHPPSCTLALPHRRRAGTGFQRARTSLAPFVLTSLCLLDTRYPAPQNVAREPNPNPACRMYACI
jgi:hypothetical protein